MRKIMAVAALAVVLATLSTSCGSSDSDKKSATYPQCVEAFSDYAKALAGEPVVDEEPFQELTRVACVSKAEWLSAAQGQQFGGSVLFEEGVNLEKVWEGFCSGNEDDEACAN